MFVTVECICIVGVGHFILFDTSLYLFVFCVKAIFVVSYVLPIFVLLVLPVFVCITCRPFLFELLMLAVCAYIIDVGPGDHIIMSVLCGRLC